MREKSEELYLNAGADRAEPQASGSPSVTERAGRAWRSAHCLLGWPSREGSPLRPRQGAFPGRLSASCAAQRRRQGAVPDRRWGLKGMRYSDRIAALHSEGWAGKAKHRACFVSMRKDAADLRFRESLLPRSVSPGGTPVCF